MTEFTQSIFLQEDFNDGIANAPPWQTQHVVSEHDGYLDIQQAQTDIIGTASYEFEEAIYNATLSFDRFSHSAGNYFLGRTGLSLTNADGEDLVVSVSMVKSDYAPDYRNDVANYDKPRVVLSDGTTSANVHAFSTGASTSSTFNKWITTEVKIDSDAGILTVDIESDGVVDVTIADDRLEGATLNAFQFNSYGWFTGHYSYFDNVDVRGIAASDVASERAITLVSRDSDGVQGNNWSGDASISGDGRFIVYESDASNLVSGDTNVGPDVMLHDLLTGETTRISVANDGSQLLGTNYDGRISADGRYIAFETRDAASDANDDNSRPDVYLFDRETGDVTLVSATATDVAGSDSSYVATLSGDGRHVVFESLASNLTGETVGPGVSNIYLRDLTDGTTTLISETSTGTASDGDSFSPTISADGRHVAFTSNAQNLTSGTPSGLFLRDTVNETTIDVLGDTLNGANNPILSDDGQFLIFDAQSTNADGSIGPRAVFRYNIETQELETVSTNTSGTVGSGSSYDADTSADGRFVVFVSAANDLVDDDTNIWVDVFVKDMETGQIVRVSEAADGTEANRESFDPSISADGSTITFNSLASNLVANDTNNTSDVFAVGNPLLNVDTPNRGPEWVSDSASSDFLAALDTPGVAVDVALADYIIDPDDDPLTFEVTGLPNGLNFDTATGQITGLRDVPIPVGTTVSVSATDSNDASLSLSLNIGGFPPGNGPWEFDLANPDDIMLFAHMANDAYNGDETADDASTTIRPPEGWSVLRATWDGAGDKPKDELGTEVTVSELPFAPGMQALAYQEDATGRIVVAYRGTDDRAADDTLSELVGTSILLGLGVDQEGVTDNFAKTEDYLRSALQFYTDVIDQAGVTHNYVSFTGHSLGGMLAGYVAGLTAGSGMIFASGPHSSMFSELGGATQYLGAAAASNPDYGFLTGPVDLSNLMHTRVDGEMLGLGVGFLTDAISYLDLVTPDSTILGLAVSFLNDNWGDAENLAVLLEELGTGDAGLTPIDLHSMSLHQLITHGTHNLGLTNYLNIDGILGSFFDDGLAQSVQTAMSQGPGTAAELFRLATLGIEGAGPDVLTDLLRDAEGIAARSNLPALGLIEPGFILNRDVLTNNQVETAVFQIMQEHAYRSMIAQMVGDDTQPAFDAATYTAPPLGGWRDIDMTVMNGGRWYGLQDLLRIIGQDAELGLDLDRSGYGIRDRMYVRADQTGTGTLTTEAGSDDLVIGGTGPANQGVNINAGSGNDIILGSHHDDVIKVQSGVNVLVGGDGDDLILGGKNVDYVSGGRNADRLYGAKASDTMFGGSGADQMFGGSAADELHGGSKRDTLQGEDGRDDLFGGSGSDLISGGEQNDSLSGGEGNDELKGGAGQDTLKGGSNADTLNGGAGMDTLTGGNGEDKLYGGSEADTLNGGQSRDKLFGGSGADTLSGNGGNDTLTGGKGADMLTGGGERDFFVFSSTSESLKGGKNRDKIMDFERGTDLIDLSDIDAKSGGLFNNRFSFVGKNDADRKGELGYKVVDNGVILQGEIDGDGIIDFQILIVGVDRLTQSDILL